MVDRASRKLVYGVGINDADYPLYEYEEYINSDGKKCTKTVWRCPFYKTWCSMLQRACCEKFKRKFPSYSDVTVSEDWKVFSKFRSWMEKQDWEDMQLDKDLLSKDKKIYSAETCAFIPQFLNSAFNRDLNNKDLPVGVISGYKGKFTASVGNKHLGTFSDPMVAHLVWQKAKVKEIQKLIRQYEKIKGHNRDIVLALICIANNIEKDANLGVQTIEYKNTL